MTALLRVDVQNARDTPTEYIDHCLLAVEFGNVRNNQIGSGRGVRGADLMNVKECSIRGMIRTKAECVEFG